MPEAQKPEATPTDPKQHAALLLDQADQLVQLARELRREARRLNGSLGLPEHRPLDSMDPGVTSSIVSTPPAVSASSAAPRRRFVPASEGIEPAEIDGRPDDLGISDGARLMITGMAISGSSREEIMELMQDELGLENADAILRSLRL
jgi:hypothetical protein